MPYQPRNRRLCVPAVIAFHVGDIPFYIDDAYEPGKPCAWGREDSVIRVVSHYGGRFTLCDDRGRYLKREKVQRNEYQRRVKTFATPQSAARWAVENQIESCE